MRRTKKLHLFASPQSRIPLLEKKSAPRAVATVYTSLTRQYGAVPNLFKVLGHTPELARGLEEFLRVLTQDGALPGWYKELIAARISILQRCAYSYSAHTASARLKGANEEQIAGLQFYERGPFTVREKRGFRFADQIHRGPEHVDEFLFHVVRQYFTAAEIVELTATASTVEHLSRFVSALRIPVTPIEAEPVPRRKTPRKERGVVARAS